MSSIDHWITGLSDGTSLIIVLAMAVGLGLRHATDPDHLAAVSALAASRDDNSTRSMRRLGFVWGLGDATTLIVFGIPIVLFSAYLPQMIQRGVETAIGVMIATLAVLLLLRYRRQIAHAHAHTHLYSHTHAHAHEHVPPGRSPFTAYVVGLMHGAGGTAGIGVLLLSRMKSHVVGVAALVVFAFFTAVSMALISSAWGVALRRFTSPKALERFIPAFALTSLAFGIWYTLGALTVVPYTL